MSNYYYSPKFNAFFYEDLLTSYVKKDAWPDDALMISRELHQSLLEGQMKGMAITAGDDGLPVLVMSVDKTPEEKLAFRESKVRRLIKEANTEIDILNDAIELGVSTSDEKNKLREWKAYRVELSRLQKRRNLDDTLPLKP